MFLWWDFCRTAIAAERKDMDDRSPTLDAGWLLLVVVVVVVVVVTERGKDRKNKINYI